MTATASAENLHRNAAAVASALLTLARFGAKAVGEGDHEWAARCARLIGRIRRDNAAFEAEVAATPGVGPVPVDGELVVKVLNDAIAALKAENGR